MTEKQLVSKAYSHSHQAADISTDLQFKISDDFNRKKATTELLEQARALCAAAQELENLSRGHDQPKRG